MLSELPANSFVYCVSSRITPEVFQVASQLVFDSVFRILWVTLNFYRVASQLGSFLCFGFCELHWTCLELPANSFFSVLTSADCIRVPSFLKFIPVCIGFSCLYFYAFYRGRRFILVDKIVFDCVKFLDILFWYISKYIVS